ncbi:LpxI family protein [Acidimangrovimonas sediminis]|uniref:LpxI family protein n=1 Tax=Acidimangrovimonas sediminis TaxID=2056283 RepID=UPI000C80491C|nr:UDP-2,3-diacylglucosamine diphosphatase LpxI [Acidimangrovimonas sediminis]
MTGQATEGRLALIAGIGALPALLSGAERAAGGDPLICALDGTPPEGVEASITFRLERLMPFLDQLEDEGVTRVAFAGGMRRPALDPMLFDPATAQIVPALVPALQAGDDATLRAILGLFEEAGFSVVGADAIAPDLVPGAGLLGPFRPSSDDERDAARAAEIVAALGAADVGQGAVVAQGLCLAVEALPGTDAMLDFVAATCGGLRPDPAGARGVFHKAPKPGQERRMDLPALGPETVRRAAAAGLAGISWEAGGVLLLGRDAVLAEAEAAGLFLWSRE